MQKIQIVVIFIFLGLTCGKTNAQNENSQNRPIPELNPLELEKKNFPKALFFVNDYEHLLSNDEILDLEVIINDFRIATKNEILVVTIDNIAPYTNISNYTLDLSNYLHVGQGNGNGLTIVVSKKLRKVQICTSDKTEKNISDDKCSKVINEFMIPNFKNDKYFYGLKSGLLELIEMCK